MQNICKIYAKYMQNICKVQTLRHILDNKSKMLKYALKTEPTSCSRSDVKYAFLHIYVQCQKIQFQRGVTVWGVYVYAGMYIYMQLACRQQLLLCLPFCKAPVERRTAVEMFPLVLAISQDCCKPTLLQLVPFYISWCYVGCMPRDSQNSYDMQCIQEQHVVRLTC